MVNQKWVFVAVILVWVVMLPFVVVAEVNKPDKDAILGEIAVFVDKKPEILRSVVFSMADEYTRENKIDEAIALYQKALKVLPDNEDFLNRLGSLFNQKSDFASLIGVYEKLTKLKPDNVWYFNMLSDAYKRAGEKDKAAKVWEDLTKQSKNPDVFIQAGNFYNNENDMERAVSSVKKAVELAPDNVGYQQTLESFLMRAEKFKDAEEICRKLIKGAKDQWMKDWANSELINIYQRQDKLQELAVMFEDELKNASQDISQYKKLASLYERSNQQDKAIEVYERAVAKGVDDRDVNNRLLDLYDNSGNADKAELQAKKMLQIYPNESFLYERLANLLYKAGKKEDAKSAWLDFLKKVPNDAGAFSRFGDKLNEWGDVNGAIEQYRKAQVLDTKNLWYSIRVADILISNNKLEEARKELKAVALATSDNWMKQEVERRMKDIDAKLGTKIEEPKVTPTKVTEPVKEEKPVGKKVKKGLFGR